jgi:replicative DNA helicase
MPRRSDLAPLSNLIRAVDAAADGTPSPDTVPSGFPSLDKILGGGFRRGDLVVVGGDVGSGKSALALAIALRVAQEGRATTFLSGEMSPERIMERALAIEGRARVDDLRRGTLDEATRAGIGGAAVRLRDHDLIVEALPASTVVEALEEELRRAIGLQMAVIDPLQALAGGGGVNQETLVKAVALLKRLAVELNIVVLLTAHLPGLESGRADPRPRLDDFGVGGAVKHHADVVLGLYREEMYQPGHGVEGATELLVRKNRNGPTGYVDLYFYTQWMRFEDMLDPDR